MITSLKRKARLRYKGFETTPSVEISAVMIPGYREYDGGLPGVSFRWLKRRYGGTGWFFPCKSLDEFFADYRFSNLELCDGTLDR